MKESKRLNNESQTPNDGDVNPVLTALLTHYLLTGRIPSSGEELISSESQIESMLQSEQESKKRTMKRSRGRSSKASDASTKPRLPSGMSEDLWESIHEDYPDLTPEEAADFMML